MKDDLNILRWLDTAVSGIRFGPDRAEVRQELLEHLEDKTLDLQRVFPDIPEEEARERALSAMGDAEELKVSLAKIHRPWLGWLWTASRIPAIFMLSLVGIYLLFWLVMIPLSMWDQEARLTMFGQKETVWSREVREQSVPLEPAPERPVVDGCLLTMERAWLVEEGAVYPEDKQPTEGLTLQAEISVRSPRFWVNDYTGLRTRLAAEDDLGNRYPSWQERWDDPYGYQEERWVGGRETPRNPPMFTLRPFTQRYVFFVYDVDPAAEELRLEYDWMGREFSMTVELKEAGT